MELTTKRDGLIASPEHRTHRQATTLGARPCEKRVGGHLVALLCISKVANVIYIDLVSASLAQTEGCSSTRLHAALATSPKAEAPSAFTRFFSWPSSDLPQTHEARPDPANMQSAITGSSFGETAP